MTSRSELLPLSMNRGLNVTGSVSSLSPRGTSGERAGERGNQTKTASSPRLRGRSHGGALACAPAKLLFHLGGRNRFGAAKARPSPPSFLRRRGRSRRFMVPRHAQKRKGAFHEPRSSGRESAHYSPTGKVRADSRRLLRGSWSRCTRVSERMLSKNCLADARRETPQFLEGI